MKHFVHRRRRSLPVEQNEKCRLCNFRSCATHFSFFFFFFSIQSWALPSVEKLCTVFRIIPPRWNFGVLVLTRWNCSRNAKSNQIWCPGHGTIVTKILDVIKCWGRKITSSVFAVLSDNVTESMQRGARGSSALSWKRRYKGRFYQHKYFVHTCPIFPISRRGLSFVGGAILKLETPSKAVKRDRAPSHSRGSIGRSQSGLVLHERATQPSPLFADAVVVRVDGRRRFTREQEDDLSSKHLRMRVLQAADWMEISLTIEFWRQNQLGSVSDTSNF